MNVRKCKGLWTLIACSPVKIHVDEGFPIRLGLGQQLTAIVYFGFVFCEDGSRPNTSLIAFDLLDPGTIRRSLGIL